MCCRSGGVSPPFTSRSWCAGRAPSSGGVTDKCAYNHLWSLHSNGANFAFADGSIHFLPYTIGNLVMQDLSTYAGGEVVPTIDF